LVTLVTPVLRLDGGDFSPYEANMFHVQQPPPDRAGITATTPHVHLRAEPSTLKKKLKAAHVVGRSQGQIPALRAEAVYEEGHQCWANGLIPAVAARMVSENKSVTRGATSWQRPWNRLRSWASCENTV
jgi:hypothetical protein